MPEESVAAYVNNIITFALFTAVIILVFIALFLLSRTLIYRIGSKQRIEPGKEISPYRPVNYKRDPYRLKNMFILGLIFISIVFFIFLVISVLNYAREPALGLNLYLIAGMIFYFILIAVYIVKSRIIS